MPQIDDILRFWFSDAETGQVDYNRERKAWFVKNSEFDQQIRDRFYLTYKQAASGELDSWQSTPAGCLALMITLDQFPRNMFRGDPAAFATDAKALAIAKSAIAQGFDQLLQPVQRIFMYLPLEHSENLADQIQSVALYQQLISIAPHLEETLSYAIRHKEVIERFGRFPHRNKILGRETTPEEAEFLRQPGSSF